MVSASSVRDIIPKKASGMRYECRGKATTTSCSAAESAKQSMPASREMMSGHERSCVVVRAPLEVTISLSWTTFLWFRIFRILISRIAVIGN